VEAVLIVVPAIVAQKKRGLLQREIEREGELVDSLSMMAFFKSLTLLLLLAIVQGKPNQRDEDYYGDQANEYGDYSYDEDPQDMQDDVDGQSRESPNSISKVRPVIVSQPEHLVVDNGMTISLPCLVDQIPAGVQIMWQKLDSKKTIIAVGEMVIDPQLNGRAFVTVTEKGSTLAIGAAKTEDAGQYKCEVAVQQNPPELKHTVDIRAPPSISSHSPASIEVEKGQDVTLSCKGTGAPSPAIKWTRVGHKMPGGENFVESDSVTFTRVTRKHAGIYKCTASNGHGQGATKQMEVVVRYKPEVDVSEVFVHKKAGDEAELVCTVHAFPPATVRWYKSGSEVLESERVKVQHRGGRHALTVKQIERSDFGEYSCRASNEIGSSGDKSVKLSGHAMPATFKSSQSGSEESKFLIEWTSFSFSQITDFKLETKPASYGSWQAVIASKVEGPSKEPGPFLYSGKSYLTDLQGATQYQARISANNGEGWGEPGPAWNFATKGAEPSVKAGAGVQSASILLLISCFALLVKSV